MARKNKRMATNRKAEPVSTSENVSESANEAVMKALRIVEVLEGIILQLPPQKIAPLQRVDKLWKATIEGSVKIQVALGIKQLKSKGIEDGLSIEVPNTHIDSYVAAVRASKAPMYTPLMQDFFPSIPQEWLIDEDSRHTKSFLVWQPHLVKFLDCQKTSSLRKALAVQPCVKRLRVWIAPVAETQDHPANSTHATATNSARTARLYFDNDNVVNNKAGIKILDIIRIMDKEIEDEDETTYVFALDTRSEDDRSWEESEDEDSLYAPSEDEYSSMDEL